MTLRPKILADHKKQGQTLLPPFTHMLGPIHEVSWVKKMIPELLWIALIHSHHGDKRGVQLITSMTRAARDICRDTPSKIFATASNYSALSPSEGEQLREIIAMRRELPLVQESLEPLISWYPECPMGLLFAERPTSSSHDTLQQLKTVVSSLHRRSERDPMMVQATAVWLAFDADMLKVAQGLALAQFPEIEHYPETDLSRRIGASIRGTLNVLFGSERHYSNEYPWPRYFWNRGLTIDQCEFSHGQ
jgi:hypothetical protein